MRDFSLHAAGQSVPLCFVMLHMLLGNYACQRLNGMYHPIGKKGNRFDNGQAVQ